MNRVTPRSTLQLAAIALVAFSGVVAVCEGCGSSSGGSGGASGDDAGASDGAKPHDGAAADHASPEAAVPDTGSGDDAGGDASATCPPPTSSGDADATCSACVVSNCEAAWCSCKGDLTGIDDAGETGCLRYVACAQDCVASDAGSPTACLQQICAKPTLNPIEKSEGQTFIDCLVQYCDAECVE